jgi:hypothetical protein
MEAPTGVLRRDRQEPHSMPVQQARHGMVDMLAIVVEDASLATSRWCRSRDYKRRATPGCPYCCCHCCCCSHWTHCSCLSPSPCPYPCLCHRCLGWGQEGEGPPEDTMVPAVVGAEVAPATQGILHLRAWSRTRWPVPASPSGPA